MLSRTRIPRVFLALTIFGTVSAFAQATLEIKDYLTLPMTGLVDGKGSNDLLLSRVNTLREEAGGSRRFFISDLNGPQYIVDKETNKFTVYLDFNGNSGKTGIFHKLTIVNGYGNGLNGFYLDPDYTKTGKFYTLRTRHCRARTSPTTRISPG